MNYLECYVKLYTSHTKYKQAQMKSKIHKTDAVLFLLMYETCPLIKAPQVIRNQIRSIATSNIAHILLTYYHKVRHPRCVFIINQTGVYLLSNTTIWWRYIYIYIIYYIENNYMFRHLIIAIFRLYMKHLVSSYTKHIYELLIWVGRG